MLLSCYERSLAASLVAGSERATSWTGVYFSATTSLSSDNSLTVKGILVLTVAVDTDGYNGSGKVSSTCRSSPIELISTIYIAIVEKIRVDI